MVTKYGLVFFLGFFVAFTAVAYAGDTSPVAGLIGVIAFSVLLILKQRPA